MSSQLVLIFVVSCLFAGTFAKPRTVVNAVAENEVAGKPIDVAAQVSISDASPNQASKPPTNTHLYNDIFNIPTSILGAVNRLLTGGGKVSGSASSGAGAGAATGTGGQFGIAGRIGGGASDGADIGGSLSSGASSGGGHTSGTGGTISGFFDNVFNIPITALQAVNQLLNNNHKVQGAASVQASGK